MKILGGIQEVPEGLMAAPLLLGINTFTLGLINIECLIQALGNVGFVTLYDANIHLL